MPRSPKKRSKLRGVAKQLTSKFIAEEIETGKYPRKQAIAVGISRAKREAKSARTIQLLQDMLRKY